MTKHTPGPWEVAPLAGKYYGTKVLLGNAHIEVWTSGTRPLKPSAREIASGWNEDYGMDHVESEEDFATAQLIAAAPELLAALSAMLTHMGMDEDEWNKPTFDQARAAIAKATGTP